MYIYIHTHTYKYIYHSIFTESLIVSVSILTDEETKAHGRLLAVPVSSGVRVTRPFASSDKWTQRWISICKKFIEGNACGRQGAGESSDNDAGLTPGKERKGRKSHRLNGILGKSQPGQSLQECLKKDAHQRCPALGRNGQFLVLWALSLGLGAAQGTHGLSEPQTGPKGVDSRGLPVNWDPMSWKEIWAAHLCGHPQS